MKTISPDQFIQTAIPFIGKVQYEYGATLNTETNTETTDCSGFLFGIFKSHGITIPRCSIEQYKESIILHSPEQQNPEIGKKGDLMFWFGTREDGRKNTTHVAFIEENKGNGVYQTLESARSENGVARVIRTLNEKNHIGRFPYIQHI